MDPADTRPTPDLSRWAELSPLLDELLDLDAAARHERLQALRRRDAALAADLAALLARDAVLEHKAFLAQPALPLSAGVAGQRLGAYTLRCELGRGGMGCVWLAERSDGRYRAEVAIKLLATGLLGAGDAGRFAREGQILARLDHPHIARLLDAGLTEGGSPYLVLEYIAGLPIDQWVSEHALDVHRTVRLFLDVLDAVAHAQQRLILHRDLKPSNILVTAAGEVKLLDFGIAKLMADATVPAAATELTQQAGHAYTLRYAAPEQLASGEVTTATDVYALGVLLYGLLGGGHPTPAAGSDQTAPLERMRAVLETVPKRLSEAVPRADNADSQRRRRTLRGDVDTIVARALKKVPAERYANAAALADDLRRWLAHEPIAARPDSATYVLAKFVRRHRVAVAAGGAAAFALAAAVGSALVEGRDAQRQREHAEGLIGFMLGELREKLQPVGRLDVLDAVGDKALAYYAAQEPARLDADSLGRRARALHLIGEVAEQRGRLDDAARMFQQAADSTAELLAREPGNAQRVFEHAQSVFWLGNLARQRGLVDEAGRQFQRYLELAQELLRLDPARPAWRDEEAYAHTNLGILALDAGRLPQALTAFETVRAYRQAELVRRPELRGPLAAVLGWIGDVHERGHDFAAALRVQRERVALLQATPHLDDDMQALRALANGWETVGVLELCRGDAVAADAALRQAALPYSRLLERDASNLDLVAREAFVHLQRATAYWALGDAAAMHEALDRAAQALPRLLGADARKLEWQVQLRGRLSIGRARWAALVGQRGDGAEIDAVLKAGERLEAGGAHLSARQHDVLGELALALGDRLAGQGDTAAAQAQWNAAVQRLSTPARDDSPFARTARAEALLRLGRVQEARALADRLEASGFRHPVYAELRRRLASATNRADEGGRPGHGGPAQGYAGTDGSPESAIASSDSS